MLIFSTDFREYIGHILVSVYREVVDYSSFSPTSTVVIGNIDVFSSSFDDSRGDKGESTLIDAVDWQWWNVFAVNVFL
jgi:hypothetical protein